MSITLNLFKLTKLDVGDESHSLIMFGTYKGKNVVGKLWAGNRPNLEMERQVYDQLMDRLGTPHVPTYIGAYDADTTSVLKTYIFKSQLPFTEKFSSTLDQWTKDNEKIHMHVTTLCPGVSLDTFIRITYPTMTVDQQHQFDREISIQMAQVLICFHNCGLTHND